MSRKVPSSEYCYSQVFCKDLQTPANLRGALAWRRSGVRVPSGPLSFSVDLQVKRERLRTDPEAVIGECFETASRIKEGDRSSWYEAWTKTAERMKYDAEESLKGFRWGSIALQVLRAYHLPRFARPWRRSAGTQAA